MQPQSQDQFENRPQNPTTPQTTAPMVPPEAPEGTVLPEVFGIVPVPDAPLVSVQETAGMVKAVFNTSSSETLYRYLASLTQMGFEPDLVPDDTTYTYLGAGFLVTVEFGGETIVVAIGG